MTMKRGVMQGTAFQKEVWRMIADIPRGRITTYASIAAAIGRPRALRAVGTAVGKNPYAPRVPCHRVVRADGSVGSYAYGVKRKKELLRSEGVLVDGDTVQFFNLLFLSAPRA